jgi:predicted HTH transcriptional regulator
MIQNDKYYLDLINKGENEQVEFKIRNISERIFGELLTAFANSEGGHIFIGIEDKRKILGLKDEEALWLLNRLNKISKSILPYPIETSILKLEGKNVVYGRVEKAPNSLKPLTTATGEVFKRDGEKTIKVPPEKYKPKASTKKAQKKLKGFVAMSFRDEEEPSLIDYYKAMERAVKRTKLPIEITRMDLKEGDYEISQQIMIEIKSADFVIADFSLNSHNVYFEIGYARGVGKRIIQTSRKDTPLQFDVNHWRTLIYRNATELEEKLISELIAAHKQLTK